LITASSAALQYLILKQLLLDYSVWFFFFGLFGTLIGQTGVSYIIKKYNRTSFIVFSITIVIFSANLMGAASGVLAVISDVNNGRLGVKPFC
jgi:uncharacterized membrane protein YfcA